MVSIASNARATGFLTLRRVSGEQLVFRNANVDAVVDRRPERAIPNDRADFQEREASRIELLRRSVEAIPRAGEYFQDRSGRQHRIQKVGVTDLTYWAECDVSGGVEEIGS